MTITVGMLVATLLVGVLSMVVGFIWYSLQVFGTSWMEENKFKMEEIQQGAGVGYAYTFLAALVTGFMLSFMVSYFVIETFVGVVGFTFAIWFGFVATTYVSNYVFTMKSFKLFLIDTGYYLVFFLLSGVIVHFIR